MTTKTRKAKPRTTRSSGKAVYDLKIPVAFGGVSIGEETASLGCTVERNSLNLDEADEHFSGKQLDALIQVLAKDVDKDQQELPGMEPSHPLITCIAGVKRFGCNAKKLTFRLQFTLESIDVEELAHFAKRNGQLSCKVIADLAAEPEDDDVADDEE